MIINYFICNVVLTLSDEVENESFTFAHEFGHYLDKHLDIRNNPEIINTFKKEKKNLLENHSQFEAQRLDYFISNISYSTRDVKGSIGEMIAEVNAFLYDSNTDERIELRGQYLQQYFPETFALIAKSLTNY